MKRRFIQPCTVLAGATFVCAAFGGCARDSATDGKQDYPPVQKIDNPLVEGYNEFGFRLFRRLNESATDKNVLISPFSISTALAMTLNGARGATQDEMSKALGATALSMDARNNANSALQSSLGTPGSQITLTTANSLWGHQGVEFKEPFLDINRRSFGAQIQALDFNDPQSAVIINNWVSQQTRGKIPDIVDEQLGAVLVLINAVYFKGQWQTQFDVASTRTKPFHISAGKSTRVPMMSQKGDFQYFEDTSATKPLQAVSLPYGDGRLSLYLLLPGKKSSTDALLKELTGPNWSRWMNRFAEREGYVTLPRFKMAYDEELTPPLKANGLKLMFEPGKADFSGMSDLKPLYVSRVRHRAVVEVNEEGTEAAAVTSVEMNTTSASADTVQPFQFVADRPFIAVLRDNATGMIIFLGAVRDPQ
jgi:serpin B